MPQRFLFQAEDRVDISAGVDDAKDTNLASFHAIENHMVIHGEGAGVWPQMRFEALADVRKSGKQAKLIRDGPMIRVAMVGLAPS
jgi:hypothetical protein